MISSGSLFLSIRAIPNRTVSFLEIANAHGRVSILLLGSVLAAFLIYLAALYGSFGSGFHIQTLSQEREELEDIIARFETQLHDQETVLMAAPGEQFAEFETIGILRYLTSSENVAFTPH